MAASTNNPLHHGASSSEVPTTEFVRAHVNEANAKGSATIRLVHSTLASATALSWMSSATFHLIIWGLLLLAYQLSGIASQKPSENQQRTVIGTLGDQDVVDDLPLFELAGEVSLELEMPAGVGDDLALQMSQELQRSGFGLPGNGADSRSVGNLRDRG